MTGRLTKMEIWKTVLFVLGILSFSENELTVKNLSCFCHGENVTTNVACPAAKWPRLNSNWFLECREGARCVIKAAVILPKNTSYVTSLAKVVPALYLAEEDAKARGILPRGVVFSFKQYDDQCKADEGQISAVEAYANDRPHVIFGPTCEYSVASVARMVRYWNIPLLTVGAMTLSLNNRTSCTNQYHLLVRAGVVDFSQITAFIIRVFAAYKWKKVNLVYEKNGYSYVSGVYSCKLMMENLVHSLIRENITFNGIDLEAESSKHFIRDSLASKKFLNDNSTSSTSAVLALVTVALVHAVHTRIVHSDKQLNSSPFPSETSFLPNNASPSHFYASRHRSVTLGVLRLAVIAPNDASFDQSLKKILPAVRLAVDAVSHPVTGILPAWDIQVNYMDSNCSSIYGPLAAVEMYMRGIADAFLGPVCDYVIAPVARYGSVWGIPVLTAGAQADAFMYKTKGFQLITRMMGSYKLVGEAMKQILEFYGWKRAGFLFHNHDETAKLGNSECHFTSSAVFRAINESTNIHVVFDEEKVTPQDIIKLVIKVTQRSRIVVVCANPDTVREILLAAEELKMVDSGEYVFFNIELFNSMNNDSYTPWYKMNDTEERNERAKKAYTALLTVRPMTPENDEYKNFSEKVKEFALKNYSYDFGNNLVSTFITSFYDAVILYSLAVNETLTANESIVNGNDVIKRMWNRTFDGITGKVFINENGDRDADYSLLDMNPDTSRFEVVANYIGANKSLLYVRGRKIHWAANRENPPPDTPTCGFDGSLCESMPGYAILSIVLSTIVVIMIVSSVFIYRHFKLEAEIASMTWKIYADDLEFITEKRGQGSFFNLGRRGSQMTMISYGQSNNDQRYTFIQQALYKNNVVAVKNIEKRKLELNRSLLYEFKVMKDLHHDHLVRFYGACIEPKVIRFITEYCRKGSLEDILDNDQIQLDWMFKFSLMQDIVRGMIYLHNSEIRSHGNLKSSNCLVDARFVLKISDFGLHSVRVRSDLDANDHAYWKRMLWTAPELLRMANPPPQGTQKGDVYSFGIIIHEMMTRQGPFYIDDLDMSPQRIIENVKNGQKPSFRPIVDELLYREDPNSREVITLMKKCWGEEPADRPDFTALKSHISKLNKENESGNILDNLLSRMEQYANNLEALVEERTSDYLEEKKKCEELLYQLLPKSVASQLIKGQSVIAETYDQVTIYFSDIVGFTSLSAESTPMQVVDMLNDLYTCFDSIVENYDVYKVETIGDAYMVASGLPVRNGNLHAREIARVSLAFLAQVRDFRIRHRPSTQLKLRIGMHTGPCVAGVVGLKMPRYCLFGDTVNTASRMESNGEAMKIHVSSHTKEVLDTFNTFELRCRGQVEIKGKGLMTTYWLLGEKTPANEDCSGASGAPAKASPDAKSARPQTPTSPSQAKPLRSDVPAAASTKPSQINNAESKSYVIPDSSTPLLTNASRDSLV